MSEDFSLTSVWMLDLEFNGDIKGVIVPSWRCVLDGLQRPVVIGREANIILLNYDWLKPFSFHDIFLTTESGAFPNRFYCQTNEFGVCTTIESTPMHGETVREF